jgi:hypothetical protein
LRGRAYQGGEVRVTNVDLDGIAIGKAAHVTLREDSVREQRQQDEFGQC